MFVWFSLKPVKHGTLMSLPQVSHSTSNTIFQDKRGLLSSARSLLSSVGSTSKCRTRTVATIPSFTFWKSLTNVKKKRRNVTAVTHSDIVLIMWAVNP